MYRLIMEKLLQWKEDKRRKPLIINGARQVGKTWLMKEFGRQAYKDTVYINFDSNDTMKRLFAGNITPENIIAGLEMYSGKKIVPEDTLLIFDEVQEVSRALTSLKYFCEDAPEYNIVSAGSLLGIALHQGTSFPVGKVDFLKLYPLSFQEFLAALGKEKLLRALDSKEGSHVNLFHDEFVLALRQYYYIGGMPEVVADFCEAGDYGRVRTIQKGILAAYEQDFSKHAPNETVPRIREVWNNVGSQLAKENQKFIYGLLREGARAKDYETAIMWLADCGLIYMLRRTNEPRIPLSFYEDLKAFKLFFVDVGLLGCQVGLDYGTIIEGNRLFTEFKGALTEQYVMQELKVLENIQSYYYTNNRGSCEIDFIVGAGDMIVPVEVKAEQNLRAKSLRVYCEKFKPDIAVRTALTEYRNEGWLLNLPLYAVSNLKREIVSAVNEKQQ